jgi:DNA-binding HxlR family transcriptional regulator
MENVDIDQSADVVSGTTATGEPVGANCEAGSKSCDGALAEAFRFLGKRWNGVILGTLTNGTSGFAELRRNVAGISDSVLAERLSELQGAGLIIRSVDPGPPVSVSYDLSDTGRALIPAMHALTTWATDNLLDPSHHS